MKSPSLARLVGVSLVCSLLFRSGAACADELQDADKLFKAGQYPAAMQQVEAWLTKNPKDAQGRFLKGSILTEEKKTEDAVRVFKAIIEDYPELPEPYNNLAVIYAAQGAYGRAKDELESAIQADPAYALAHENLGDIYARLAGQSYEMALKLDDSNARIREKLETVNSIFSKKWQR